MEPFNLQEVGGCQVEVSEDGSGPPVLFLYDGWHTSQGFALLSAIMSEEYRTVAIDLPGLGRSPEPEYPTNTLKDYAKWMGEAVSYAGPSDVTLVLCDLGLPLGFAYLAEKHPTLKNLARVVLLNGPLYGDQGWNLFTLRKSSFLSRWDLPMDRMAHRRKILTLYGDPEGLDEEATESGWHAFRQGSLALQTRLGQEIMEMGSIFMGGRVTLLESGLPILVLWGEEDPTGGRKVAERFQEWFPSAEVYALPNVGHFPHIEASEAVATELTSFMKKEDGPDGSPNR